MSQLQYGRQEATVTACSVGESKKKGTPGVFLTLRADDGATGEASLWLTEATFERTVQTLRECFGFDDNFDTIEGQTVEKRCSITVEAEVDDKGKEWPRIKWINPIRAAAKAVGNDFLKQLSAKAARLPSKVAKDDGFPS